MDDRLGVDDDIDLLRGNVEKPTRFDNFEALVHQSGRIHSNALSHLPCRMLQRLFRSERRKLLFGCLSKRPTRCGQNQPPYFAALSGTQTLIDGAVLAVDRYDPGTALRRCLPEQFTSENHRFFIRQRYCLARGNRAVRWRQSGSADCGRNDSIHLICRCNAT